MSVYIKNMELPKDHPVCIVIDTAGQVRRYDLSNDRYTDDELLEAIPVPKHGRLVDADAMIHDIENSIAPSWYIKEKLADMIKFLNLKDAVIPASKEE